MFDSKIAKKIIEYVHAKPRSIDEIAKYIGKNWRTADRYVEKIAQETGELGVRTFREGTRGALKVVFFKNIAKLSSTQFQENLLQQIISGKQKGDFSPFDLYQYVSVEKRNAVLRNYSESDKKMFSDFNSAEKQILCFSGNMSWINFRYKNQSAAELLEKTTPKINVKIVTRIDFAGHENIEKALKVNLRTKKESIEIRHCIQPLRGYIIDDKLARIWETNSFSDYREGELNKKIKITYEITDPEWIDWLTKLFWNMFSSSIPAQKRIEDLNTVQKIYEKKK